MRPFEARPYGDRAVLLDVADEKLVLPLRDALMGLENPAILSVVPAARTVLVEYAPDAITLVDLFDAAEARLGVNPQQHDAGGAPIDVPVRYDGEDLASVADLVGVTVDEVIARHTAPTYLVQFCGFSPGFAYLTGLDPLLHLPRLATPRALVPAGSVAVAGEYAGVYPRSSPGGWRLLGRTQTTMFDLERDPPALLRPGMHVRFVQQP
jgi:KipI family sensor histidine kinase inhibitor